MLPLEEKVRQAKPLAQQELVLETLLEILLGEPESGQEGRLVWVSLPLIIRWVPTLEGKVRQAKPSAQQELVPETLPDQSLEEQVLGQEGHSQQERFPLVVQRVP